VLPFRNEEIATSSQCSQIISKSGKLPAATLRYIFAVPPAHTHTHMYTCTHRQPTYSRKRSSCVPNKRRALDTLRNETAGRIAQLRPNSREHNFCIVCGEEPRYYGFRKKRKMLHAEEHNCNKWNYGWVTRQRFLLSRNRFIPLQIRFINASRVTSRAFETRVWSNECDIIF